MCVRDAGSFQLNINIKKSEKKIISGLTSTTRLQAVVQEDAHPVQIINYFFPREMHSVFNHLLAALCIADLLFIGGNLALTPIALGKPEVFNPG